MNYNEYTQLVDTSNDMHVSNAPGGTSFLAPSENAGLVFKFIKKNNQYFNIETVHLNHPDTTKYILVEHEDIMYYVNYNLP